MLLTSIASFVLRCIILRRNFKAPGTTWCTRRHPSCGVSIGRTQIEEVHSSHVLLEAVHFNAIDGLNGRVLMVN